MIARFAGHYCRTAAEWPDGLGVSVNLSPLQFKQGDLLQAVARALNLTRLAPARLELEITESILLENTDTTIGVLGHLRDLGVRIAMDDFGIGFSRLSSLSRFHFDKIKIDKSFIAGLGKNDHSAAIIEAVATLGATMGMTTTAEGAKRRLAGGESARSLGRIYRVSHTTIARLGTTA